MCKQESPLDDGEEIDCGHSYHYERRDDELRREHLYDALSVMSSRDDISICVVCREIDRALLKE